MSQCAHDKWEMLVNESGTVQMVTVNGMNIQGVKNASFDMLPGIPVTLKFEVDIKDWTLSTEANKA